MNALRNITAASAASVALALSDGTPVEFVKITSKDNIQVRVPTSHPLGAADPLRIFRRDGTHYKDATSITLVGTDTSSAAAPATTSAPAAANDDTGTFVVDGQNFASLTDAKDEALDIFRDGGVDNVTIYKLVPVGVVGFTSLAA